MTCGFCFYDVRSAFLRRENEGDARDPTPRVFARTGFVSQILDAGRGTGPRLSRRRSRSPRSWRRARPAPRRPRGSRAAPTRRIPRARRRRRLAPSVAPRPARKPPRRRAPAATRRAWCVGLRRGAARATLLWAARLLWADASELSVAARLAARPREMPTDATRLSAYATKMLPLIDTARSLDDMSTGAAAEAHRSTSVHDLGSSWPGARFGPPCRFKPTSRKPRREVSARVPPPPPPRC